jgi:hypothetical protein
VIAGYSRYLGISAADLIASMASPPTASDVATAVVKLSTTPEQSRGKVFVVSGKVSKRRSLAERQRRYEHPWQ